MICPNCGEKLRDSAKFCSWCGEKLSGNEEKSNSVKGIFKLTPKEILEDLLANTPIHSYTPPEPPEEEKIPDKPPPELAVGFDKTDDLFVVSEQPAHAAPPKSENSENFPQEISPESVRFPVRYGYTVLILAFLAVLCILSIYFIPNRILPLIKYKNAEKLFQEGNYSAASIEFSELGDYSDSREYISKCQYSSAVQLMNAGSFAEAAKSFSALNGYADSDDLAVECFLRSAEIYIENGNFNAAISAYYAAGKPELAEETARSRAEALAESGDFFAAAEAAGKYSEEAAMEYIYTGSEKAMKNGDFQTAAEGFRRLGDYKNSRELLQECTYSFYASEYRINGVSGEVVRGFYTLGAYRDSEDLFVQTAYEYGMELFESGNYYEASSMFRNSSLYKDSSAMLYRSRYELGKSMEESDPASALSVFSMLGNYSDSASRKKSAASLLGEKSSVWYTDGYTSADGYCTSDFKKSDTLLVNCTAGTDSPSGTVTLVITFKDSKGSSISAECENIRNSSSFSASVPLTSSAVGKAEVTVSVRDSGEIIRRFEIIISE